MSARRENSRMQTSRALDIGGKKGNYFASTRLIVRDEATCKRVRIYMGRLAIDDDGSAQSREMGAEVY